MIQCKKEEFQLDKGIHYLNCAYMSPMHREVEEAGLKGIYAKRSPHGTTPKDFFHDTDRIRETYGKLINCARERVVIIPSVSYGLANVTANISLHKGEEVLIVEEQFPSNVYPWMRLVEQYDGELKVVQAPKSDQRGEAWNEEILKHITENTRVVALSQCHWADGTRFDLGAIREKSSKMNALLILDGTQSVGAYPFDVAEIQPDALICAGYKWLMGPYSIGLAYYGEYFDNGIPIEENWINRLYSEDFAGLVRYQDQYQPGALRYEVGEHSNFILTPMMLKALELISTWEPAEIQAYCGSLVEDRIPELQDAGFRIEEPSYRASHLFGIRTPGGVDMEKVKAELANNRILVSVRGDAIRVSPNIYNDKKDTDRLFDLLLSLTAK